MRIQNMKIGACKTNPEEIKLIHDIGYDFVEVSNTKVFSMNGGEFERLLSLKNKLREGFFHSANSLVPGDVRLTGYDVDFEKIRNFAKESFRRLSLLGVKVLVFGSSNAKNVPAGFSFDVATEQLVSVVSIFAEEASVYGMSVCIEPLNRNECNIINTAKEAIYLARKTGKKNVGGHVDYFHMTENGEDISSLASYAGELIHVHIASPGERTVVLPTDGVDYSLFFSSLRKGGYDKTVSFEGRGGKDEKELRCMLEYMRTL